MVLFLIAYGIPYFSDFLNLIGGLLSISIQYLIPVIIYLWYFKKEMSLRDKIFNYLVLGLFIPLSFLAVYYSIVQISSKI